MSYNDPKVQLATMLGIMAGDEYDPPPPQMPLPGWTSDDLDAATQSGKVESQGQPQGDVTLSGDAQMQAGQAAYAAGFRGEALATIIAIAGRESGYRVDAVGDTSLQDSTWGPSVGLFQIRTLKSQTGTGGVRDINRLRGNAIEQARAAWEISGGGTNWGPWKLHGGSHLARTNIEAARRIAQMIEGGNG